MRKEIIQHQLVSIFVSIIYFNVIIIKNINIIFLINAILVCIFTFYILF